MDLLSAYQSTERMAIESCVKYVCSPLSGVEGRGFFSPSEILKKKNLPLTLKHFQLKENIKKNLNKKSVNTTIFCVSFLPASRSNCPH